MMDDHDICESEQMVKSKEVVHHRRGMTAHISEYHGVWLHLERKSHHSVRDKPARPSPKNCSGMQRGSAQVTAEREISRLF